MKTSAQAIDEPRRGSSLVFSMMMILSAMSAGLSGIPLANATGNGEWVQVDMEKGHWENGEDVSATVKAESLGSGDYFIWYNVETINGTEATNGTLNVSDTDGDGVEEFTVSISANDLWDDCWNIYADLLDSSGSMIAGSSFTFDVGSGMCPGNPSTGPHVWWNGSYWWSNDESVFYTAEISNLDETKSYTLDWALREAGNSMDLMNGSEDLSGMGSSPTVDVYIGMLGDGCYEISGELSEGDGKQLQGGHAMYMFEVGNGTCSVNPPMQGAYITHYDGELFISAYGFEQNQTNLNIQVSLTNENGDEVFTWGDDFTTDEYGMFMTEQCCFDEDGEYTVHIVITDTTDDTTLYEAWETLHVGDGGGGGGNDPGVSAWTTDHDYSSGDDVYVDYYVWDNEGDYYEVWDCEVYVMESALQGDTSAENIEAVASTASVDWCDTEADSTSIDVGQAGNDPFNGETVWMNDEGMVGSISYDGDLNMTMTVHSISADMEMTVEEFCDMMAEEGDGTAYDATTDTCSFSESFLKFDVGVEYIYEEREDTQPDWEHTFVCDGNNTYISFVEVNDGVEDCMDGSDEPQDFDGDGVTDNWFDCHDGSTVSMDVVNDGVPDCADGEDEVSYTTDIESDYSRYSNDGTHFVLGQIEDYSEQLYDIVIEVYDEDGNWIASTTVHEDDYEDVVFSGLDDGKYGLVASLVDDNGSAVYTSEPSGFCVGDCGHGGNWLTGDAGLEVSYDWDDYVEEDCWGTLMLWEESALQSMVMDGSGDDDHDDHDHGDHDGDHGDHDGDHGDHDGDHGDHDGDHNGDDDHGDHDNNGPSPVWADSIGGPGVHSYDSLPEGAFVVMLHVDCKDEDGNEWEGGHFNPFNYDTTTLTNGSITALDIVLETRDHDDHGDEGDDMEPEFSHMEYTIVIEDDATGNTVAHFTMVGHISDYYRMMIDSEMGDGDGAVSQEEADNFAAMMAMTEEMGDDDEGPEVPEFMWNGVPLTAADVLSESMEISGLVGAVPASPDADTSSVRITMVTTVGLVDNGQPIQTLSPYDDPNDEDHGDHGDHDHGDHDDHDHGDHDGDHGDHDGDHGDHDGDHGDHDGDHDEDHGDHDGDHGDHDGDHGDHDDHDHGDHDDHDDGEPNMVCYWPNVFTTIGAFENKEDCESNGFDWLPELSHPENPTYVCYDTESKMIDNSYDQQSVCEANDGMVWTIERTDDPRDQGDGDGPCQTGDLYIKNSDSWEVVSINLSGLNHSAISDGYHIEIGCGEEPPEEGTMSFSRVADEPEPVENQPPYCDVYYYGEASELADFQSTDDKADGSNNTWEISIVEDDTYWLMFYCMDDESDSITVNITSAFGNYGETFAAGSTEGYYELTIPTGSSVLSPYSLEYTWTDGTNSGSGVVTVNVAPSDGGTDGSGEETEGEDTSAGSFVPGFTAVLTMTALAGALLVFSRRED